jgi:hypothetical protein
VIDIGRELPGRVKDKLQEIGEGIRGASLDTIQAISGETETQAKEKKKKAAEAKKKKARPAAPKEKKKKASN